MKIKVTPEEYSEIIKHGVPEARVGREPIYFVRYAGTDTVSKLQSTIDNISADLKSRVIEILDPPWSDPTLDKIKNTLTHDEVVGYLKGQILRYSICYFEDDKKENMEKSEYYLKQLRLWEFPEEEVNYDDW